MDFTANLSAGQWQRQETRGRLFLLLDTGAASSIELRFDMPGENDEQVNAASKGFKARLTSGEFLAVYMRSSVDTAARFVISDNDIDFDFFSGSTVKVTADNPLPVSNDRGSPGNLLYVSGVSLADAPATGLANAAPVACGPAAVVVAAASANRRALRFTNLGPDPVALGAAGITWANRCIVLDVGDTWVEERAANLAWSAITDAAKTASVTRQEVTA